MYLKVTAILEVDCTAHQTEKYAVRRYPLSDMSSDDAHVNEQN